MRARVASGIDRPGVSFRTKEMVEGLRSRCSASIFRLARRVPWFGGSDLGMYVVHSFTEAGCRDSEAASAFIDQILAEDRQARSKQSLRRTACGGNHRQGAVGIP